MQTKRFVKRARGGMGHGRAAAVTHVSRDHYLRDDLPIPPAPTLARQLLVPDSNVLLHALSVLEHAALKEVVYLQTVMEEVRKRDAQVYARVQQLLASPDAGARHLYRFSNEHCRGAYVERRRGESPNDYYDRLIRSAVRWLQREIDGDTGAASSLVLLLTEDRENARRARDQDGLVAISLAELADRVDGDDADLRERIRQAGESMRQPAVSATGAVNGAASVSVPEHWSAAEVERGIESGWVLLGTYRAHPYAARERGVVQVRDLSSVGAEALALLGEGRQTVEVHVVGRVGQNRSIDGDAVAVELERRVDQWAQPPSRLPRAENEGEEANDAPVADDTDSTPPPSAAVDRVPTGRVVAVMRRNWRSQYCGSLLPPKDGATAAVSSASTRAIFMPVDRRVPRVLLSTRQRTALQGQRIVVALDRWERHSPLPEGHFVRALGPIGDPDTETQVLLIENGVVTRPFSDAALACLPPSTWRVRDATGAADGHRLMAGREDLRGEYVLSVDPPGCTDIDDALHCRPLQPETSAGNHEASRCGRVEVGVHIADVTAFLRHGSALDMEARERGSTVYLVRQRLEMLPSLLTNRLCSLQPGEDRLAFSVLLEMDGETAEVRSTRFVRSVIHSRQALTYEAAQRILDGEDAPAEAPLGASLRRLNALAQRLRRRRIEAGALTLASPEIRFEVDVRGERALQGDSALQHADTDSHHLIEEFMLLANGAVAERLLTAFPQSACLRRHPSPPPEQFEPLLQVARAAGIALQVESSKALAASLDAVAASPAGRADPLLDTLLRVLVTRCMTQAVYFSAGLCAPAEYHHYGLAAPVYTHFTSPIRRYADVIVHRQLAACLGYEAAVPELVHHRTVQRLCEHVNERYRSAQNAGRDSSALYALLHLQKQMPDAEAYVEAEARVLRVLANGAVVLLPRYGLEGVLHVDEERERWQWDPERGTLTGTRSNTVYRALAPCRVRLRVVRGAAAVDRLRLEPV